MTENNNVESLKMSICQGIEDDLEDFKPLKKIADQLNIRASYIVIGIITICIIFAIFTITLAKFLITIMGVIYPSYMTFKVLKLLDLVNK
jgi:hypothetical protein